LLFYVRNQGKVINKTVYLCAGQNKDGFKEILGGVWVEKSENTRKINFHFSMIMPLKKAVYLSIA
jgi:putative transposase